MNYIADTIDMSTQQPGNAIEVSEALEALERLRDRRKIWTFKPYPKQQQFFDAGMFLQERLLMAGNQLGKTEAGAVECVYHLTGEYPKDWGGRRFDHPVDGWAAGVNSKTVRDVLQLKLCGKASVLDSLGTGYIPKELFHGTPTLARGAPSGSYDTISVKHCTNGKPDGVSTLQFKSYEQGEETFQSATLDFIWLDEEPPEKVYNECFQRVRAKSGMIYMTFTPLKGMSQVVSTYMEKPDPNRGVIVMTIDDVTHYSEEQKKSDMAACPPHERKARFYGEPMAGEGMIFPYEKEMIEEPGFQPDEIPPHWAKLWGIDFGIGHPFAAALILWDRDNDVIHVHHCFKISDTLPIQHAQAMKLVAAGAPVAWPQDGTAREKSTGDTLADAYKEQGLNMLQGHAAFPDGSRSTEAGILEMQHRITTGRFKVASHLKVWFEEQRMYHRKDGIIVKLRDDIMSATRVAVMTKHRARPGALGNTWQRSRRQTFARDIDFDLT